MNAAVPVRQRILDAGLSLLRDEGFHALTQTRVAERAGVRQSHLTYYFPTRSDLLKGLAEAAIDAALAALPGALHDGLETPTGGLTDTLASLEMSHGMPRLMLGLIVASDEDPSLKPWLQACFTHLREALSEGLGRLGLPVNAEQMQLLQDLIIGIRVQAFATGEPVEITAQRISKALQVALGTPGANAS